MTEAVWSADVLRLAELQGEVCSESNKIFTFISSVLGAERTFVYLNGCSNFYFIRMIIEIDPWKSHNPLRERLSF